MKKNELKQDPIRDKIFEFINYLDENRNYTYGFLGLIILSLGIFVVTDSKSSSTDSTSNAISSTAQNYYIDDDKDAASIKFEEILNNKSYNQNAKNIAIIYLLSKALDNNDNAKIEILLNDYKFKSNDKLLHSKYYALSGNYYYNSNDYKKALDSYSKALKNFEFYPNILIDVKISNIKSYLKEDNLKLAKKHLKSIDEEYLNTSSKNKLNSFKNTLKIL